MQNLIWCLFSVPSSDQYWRTLAKSGILDCRSEFLNLVFPQLVYLDALSEACLEALEQRRETKCRQFFLRTLLILTTNCIIYYLKKRDKSYLGNSKPHETPKVRTNHCKMSPINYGLFKFQSCL